MQGRKLFGQSGLEKLIWECDTFNQYKLKSHPIFPLVCYGTEHGTKQQFLKEYRKSSKFTSWNKSKSFKQEGLRESPI